MADGRCLAASLMGEGFGRPGHSQTHVDDRMSRGRETGLSLAAYSDPVYDLEPSEGLSQHFRALSGSQAHELQQAKHGMEDEANQQHCTKSCKHTETTHLYAYEACRPRCASRE